jgi:hypothetical protein
MLGRKPDRTSVAMLAAMAFGLCEAIPMGGKSIGPISVDPKTIPQGRNRPCPCGSKKKFKMCCLPLKAKCPKCGDGIHGKDSLCGVCYNEYLGTHPGSR